MSHDAEELARALALPLGFAPTALSCAHCKRGDRLEIKEEIIMVNGVPRTLRPAWREWLRRHRDCKAEAERIEFQVGA